MTRLAGICCLLLFPLFALAQGGDQQVRTKADGLFNEQRYAEALPLYAQLVSLAPQDRQLNYRLGTCVLFGGEDKEKAIGYLKYAVEDPSITAQAWYWLGRAYHLNYRFKEAEGAYQRYRGVADKRTLLEMPVEAFEQQCRNGQKLLSNLKEISVRSKVEVEDREFFRFYDLSEIGGRIVVTPEDLRTPLDKKNKHRGLVFLPSGGGPIYFSSFGKEGRTGLDIYRSELLPDGRYAAPIKLAGYINTDQDDDHPFMHPDGKTFYFSSKGHNSMGGYDVFRATFDRGMDAFGRPENLDFAVSTPDDDIFYITDAEHKEACFASGRNSRQGKLHVYRVSTSRLPLVITVLKGTYTSEFDANDRRARIVVEDALTREQLADIRTDINGDYVLALPRSGRFRFLVECGPSGKTHAGMVEVPRSEGPRAYRQELSLTEQGDLERLVIRNYFDDPLEGDLIALALDEIKRRARLDIHEAPATAKAEEAESTQGDVLTRAGFAGNVDQAGAIALAKEDAAALERKVTEQEQQLQNAYRLAMGSIEEAERSTREAAELVATADDRTDEAERNALMTDAARLRQSSKEANLRATAAYRTAQDLEREQLSTRQRAITATKLSADVERTLTAGKPAETEALAHLTALKQQLDARSGPQAELDLAERTRRSATERATEADRAMQRAQTMRNEETELMDRINRLKGEQENTRSSSRKEQITRELAVYLDQLEALRSEARTAYARSRVLQQETALLRGQSALTRHLEQHGEATAGTIASKEQVAALERRISGNQQQIQELGVDERFDGLIPEDQAAQEARTFDWDLASKGEATADGRSATRALDRSSSGDAQRTTGDRTGTVVRDPGERSPEQADQEALTAAQRLAMETARRDGPDRADARNTNVPATAPDGRPIEARERSEPMDRGEGDQAGERPAQQATGSERNAAATASQDQARDPRASGEADRGSNGTRTANDANEQGAAVRVQEGVQPPLGETSSAVANAQRDPAQELPGRSDQAASEGARTSEQIRAGRDNEEASDRGAVVDAPTTVDPFLLENELAELRQLASAERNRAERERLELRIVRIEEELLSIRTAGTASAEDRNGNDRDPVREALEERSSISAEDVDMSRSPLVFDRNVEDEFLVKSLYASYADDKGSLERTADADERTAGLQGLELMLADSITAEMMRQLALLELAPEQADRLLPRVDRLRRLREEHQALANELVAERLQAINGEVFEAGDPAVPPGIRSPRSTTTTSPDPINDRFVALELDPADVYTTRVEHRSHKVSDALEFKEADLARMEQLTLDIDSLIEAAAGKPRKDHDRMIKSADRMRDDRLIISADLGQRSAFLAREEWSVAQDSLKRTEKIASSRGLSPSEPLLLLAEGMKNDAQRDFDRAQQVRKQADRSNDILLRDSLYRMAYATELQALRDLDRSITVYNYLVGDEHQRGETLAYAVVASRVLGIAEPAQSALSTGDIAARTPDRASDNAITRSSGNTSVGAEAQQQETARATERTITEVPVTAHGTGVIEEGAIAPGAVAESRDVMPPVGEVREGQVPVVTAPLAAGRAGTEAAAANSSALNEEERLAEQRREQAEQGRIIALEQARRAEEALSAKARMPVERYARYLDPQFSSIDVAPESNEGTGGQFMARAQDARKEAADMEARSFMLADEASELEERSSSAKRREGQQMQLLATRKRTSSDSLLAAASLRLVEADEADRAGIAAIQQAMLRERILKYYYLSNDELELTLDNVDHSRYFQARTLALRQYDAADDAREAAASNRAVGAVLQQQAAQAPEAAAAILRIRATTLLDRADSLDNVSDRLRGAAMANEAQAAVMLQGLPDEEATLLMAREMQGRRTEPLLAEARDQAGPQRVPEAAPITPRAVVPAGASTAAIPRQLTTDLFELRAGGERAAVAIPIDAAMPEGIVFKVQIGAFRNAVPEEAFSDMTPVMGESVGNGLVRYTAGLFTGFGQAAQAKDLVRGRGYRDAFVVAYRDGVRIPLAEAILESSPVLASTPAQTPSSDQRVPRQGQEQLTEVRSSEVIAPAQVRTSAPGPVITIQSPPVTSPAAPERDIATVLAAYPASADAIIADFRPQADVASYYNVPGAAPARQVETIKGLFFTVQVGVYSRPVALDELFNITPLNSERTETGKIRYTTGMFLAIDEARIRKDATVLLGVTDAFVTAYLNGRRIPMVEARALLEKFGPAILATP